MKVDVCWWSLLQFTLEPISAECTLSSDGQSPARDQGWRWSCVNRPHLYTVTSVQAEWIDCDAFVCAACTKWIEMQIKEQPKRASRGKKSHILLLFYWTTHFLTQVSPGLVKDTAEPSFPACCSHQGEDRLGLIRSSTKIGPGVGPEWGGLKEGRRRWKWFETDPSLSTSSVVVR